VLRITFGPTFRGRPSLDGIEAQVYDWLCEDVGRCDCLDERI
jgi:hypothetical protein